MAARASSFVRGNAVQLFIMPARVGGKRRILSVVKEGAKREVLANSEEV